MSGVRVDEGGNISIPANHDNFIESTEKRSATLNHQTTTERTDATDSGDLFIFKPLQSQWQYGQPVFARYKKTPYFYSGNIAAYLGSGFFMIVFDDGTANYRIKRGDIMLRDVPDETLAQDSANFINESSESSMCQLVREAPAIANASSSRHDFAEERRVTVDKQFSHRPTMIDFSISPPRQIVLCGDWNPTEMVDDDCLGIKRLECGVTYEDDSTQVSDSDESSEEDMSMTPWQQMTQTFGMGKLRRRASRRSSISSVSQAERLSLTQKSTNSILPTPKGITQSIADFLSRKNKKIQPVHPTGTDIVLMEHIREMEAKLAALRDKYEKNPPVNGTRVIYDRGPNKIRAYGTVKASLADEEYEVITEDEQRITVQILARDQFSFLPSVSELERQIHDLLKSSRTLYAGRKVHVNLYVGSRFSGPGVITFEDERQPLYHVLLKNRIRLMNVPADKLVPLRESKRDVVSITEDQYLVCNNKIKVYIGDQVFVKCEGDSEGVVEEKLGILNGVYSNKTAAVDFADGSTGYEISPLAITKRKKPHQSEHESEVLSLKNAVLMGQVSDQGHDIVDVGYQVKADHPRKTSVESCVIIRKHASSACDVRFTDGTIAFEVFPSQMILDKIVTPTVTAERAKAIYEASVGEYVLGWSSRFGRYCSAKISDKMAEGVSALYTLVFDYGEQKHHMPMEKLARIDDADALSPMQKLTNYSIDTIGFELSPVLFTVGEAVMARVYGSVQYFHGRIEHVHEKDRTCVVQFDSSVRDPIVPFSSMFSIDVKNRYQSVSNKTSTSSSGSRSRMHFHEETVGIDVMTARQRRHSTASMGNMLISAAGSLFRTYQDIKRQERRGSRVVAEPDPQLRIVCDAGK